MRLFFCGNDLRTAMFFLRRYFFWGGNFDNIAQRIFERAIIGKGIHQAEGCFAGTLNRFAGRLC